MSCAPIPPDITIRIERGEYREQGFRVATRLPDGTTAPQSLATATELVWMVKAALADADAAAKFTKRFSLNDIVLDDQGAAPGDLKVIILSADTASLAAAVYYHQLWVYDEAGRRKPAHSPAKLILGQPVHLPV